MKTRQTGVQDILAQLAQHGINPFGPQTQTSQGGSSSTTNSSSTSATNSTSAPFILDNYKNLEGITREKVEGRLKRGAALPPGYLESQVRGINETFAGTDQAARNAAARHGLSGQQAFGLASPGQSARAGQIADLRSKLPLMEREMETQDISLSKALTEAFGKGINSSSVTNTTGTSTTDGSQWGSSTSPPNIGLLADLLLPPGPQQTGATGQSGAAMGINSIGQLLGFLLGQGALGQGTPSGYGPGFDPFGQGGAF